MAKPVAWESVEYQPPWGRRQPRKNMLHVHSRWAAQLQATWPEGIPRAEPIYPEEGEVRNWPAIFGDQDENGHPIHRPTEGEGYCFQCGGCQFYIPLEGSLGADWGVCSNATSQYDRQAVFEHWTCREFRR